MHRRHGLQPLPSQKPSDRWVQDPAFVFSHFELAKLTSWLDFQKARMKDSRISREGVATAVRGSGLGAASGPWCSSLMAKHNREILLSPIDRS
jgi:hypothetical protein